MPYISVGRRLLVGLVGYAVVVLFLVAFWILRRFLPLPLDLSVSEQITLSVIMVAPVLAAVLWGNIHGLKFGEIEVSLNDVATKLDFELASKIQIMQGSMTMELVNAISEAIMRPELKLVEVDLRAGDYWWSTRLFLLAALAEQYTQIARLVFVERENHRLYVGMASPSVIRRSLAKEFPYLGEAFKQIGKAVGGGTQAVQNYGWQWPAYLFLDSTKPPQPNEETQEQQAKQLVSVDRLKEWVPLETIGIRWNGGRGDRPLYNRILKCDEPYVPLLRGKRLELIVNRQDLVHRLAQSG